VLKGFLPPALLFIGLALITYRMWVTLSALDKVENSTDDLNRRIYQNFEFFIKVFLALVGAFGYVKFKYVDSPQAMLGHQALLMIAGLGLMAMTTVVLSVASLQGWKLRRVQKVHWHLWWTWQEIYMMLAMYALASSLWIVACFW
jgi:hypothetical protein